MSATAVSICSNALLRLGADPINSFTEGESTGSNLDSARLASNLWPTVRRQVLRGHIWNCALKRALLSPDTTAPAFGWSSRFQKPGDWIRTVAVGLEPEDRYVYISEGNYFLSDEGSLPLLYVYDNDNPATYDSALVAALEVSMAAAMAYPITKSTSLADAFTALAREHLSGARVADGQDDPPETLGDFPLIASRYGRRIGAG
jgi:hypothetical protein